MHSRCARLGRVLGLGLVGLALWLAAVSMAAQAAPLASLAVHPATGTQGTVFRLYATDLPASAAVRTVFYAPNGPTPPQTLTADASGRLNLAWLSRSDEPTGVYTAELAVAGSPVVSATFSVIAAAQPSLAVFPVAGSPATIFTLLGAGYPTGQPVGLELVRPDGVSLSLVGMSTPNGGIETTLPGVGLPLGPYTVVARVGANDVARAQFRIESLPTGCRDLVRNGGIEARPDFLWWDRAGDPLVATQGAFSGARLAVLGGYNRAFDVITQTLAYPGSTRVALLSYWRARVPEANPGSDVMRVTLSRPDGLLLRTIETVEPTSAPNVWERIVASTPYSGQAVRLAFAATTDAANATAFGVDEVAAVACDAPPAADIGPAVATLRPAPTPATVAPGDVVHVDVWVENVEGLFGLDTTLLFDPTLLKPKATQSSLGPFLHLAGQSMVTRNTVDAQQGQAVVTLTRLAPASAASGSGILFSLDFDALKPGVASLRLANTLAAAQGGTAITVERAANSVTVRIPPPSLAGHVETQGRGDAAGTVVTASGLLTTSVTANTSGDFRLDDLTPGTYTLRAQRPGWLCAARPVTLAAGQTLAVPNARLLAGDVNASGEIDLFDLTRVAFLYDSPASADPVADLNANGIIDIGDLVLVALNYGAVCPQPWTATAKMRLAPLRGLPRLSLEARVETEDGITPVEVWAEGAAEAQGLDLTLRYDPKRVEILRAEPFALGRDLSGAFVARNMAREGWARLAVSRVAAASSLPLRAHVATLFIKGDPAAVRVESAVWADNTGRTRGVGAAPVTPRPAATPAPADKSPATVLPGPRWTRLVEGLTGKR